MKKKKLQETSENLWKEIEVGLSKISEEYTKF